LALTAALSLAACKGEDSQSSSGAAGPDGAPIDSGNIGGPGVAQVPRARVVFNKDGTIANMGGVDFNPCQDQPCPQNGPVETPEMRAKNSLNWNLIKKD